MPAGTDGVTGREFGRLEERVAALDSKFDRNHENLEAQLARLAETVDRLSADVEKLSALAERGKGAYWAAMLAASSIGGFVAWMVKMFAGRTAG